MKKAELLMSRQGQASKILFPQLYKASKNLRRTIKLKSEPPVVIKEKPKATHEEVMNACARAAAQLDSPTKKRRLRPT
jgi:hypothetical protein